MRRAVRAAKSRSILNLGTPADDQGSVPGVRDKLYKKDDLEKPLDRASIEEAEALLLGNDWVKKGTGEENLYLELPERPAENVLRALNQLVVAELYHLDKALPAIRRPIKPLDAASGGGTTLHMYPPVVVRLSEIRKALGEGRSPAA